MINEKKLTISYIRKIARKAGRIALRYRKNLESLQIENKSEFDIVTEADRAVEVYLRNAILKKFPSHTIIGEEEGITRGSDREWVIDPIDGTVSFAHGHDHFAVSIGYREEGVLKLGAVYMPVLGDMYWAELGKGAWLGKKSLSVSRRKEMATCVYATGFACLRSSLERNNLPFFEDILPRLRSVRRYGSAAYDLALVAAGKLDAFWELNLNDYDVAAGILLVREAGGIVSDFSGGTEKIPCEIVAANPLTYPLLMERIDAVERSLKNR